MKYYLTDELPQPTMFTEPITLVAGVSGAEWTRSMLSFAADRAPVAGIIGWLDISSPNLVDLVDELKGNRGGEKLLGLRLRPRQPADDELPIARGLATLTEFDLSVWVDFEAAIPDLCRRFPKTMVRTLPDLGI